MRRRRACSAFFKRVVCCACFAEVLFVFHFLDFWALPMPEQQTPPALMPIECPGSDTYCLAIKALPAPNPKPQAIFVLGGDRERETFAVEFARLDTDLDVWVSSGQNDANRLMDIPWLRGRVHIDWKALDTVTNFSTMVAQLKSVGVTSVYLVTSDYHMRRANAVASVMLGMSGIKHTCVVVPPAQARPPEPFVKVVRDVVRAFIWVVTGLDFRFAVGWFLPARAQISQRLRGRQQQERL
jgi:uncharacterized SAM-binding protein YcdF (DUF218 family)